MAGLEVESSVLFQIIGEQYTELIILRKRLSEIDQSNGQATSVGGDSHPREESHECSGG
jgi:hypothetical protein